MIELLQLKGQVKPIHEVAAAFQNANPKVFGMQDMIHYLQLAIYWYEGGAELLFKAQSTDDVEHSSEEPGIPWPPTPAEVNADSRTQLAYMFDSLGKLEMDTVKFMESRGIDYFPKFYIEGALTKIIEAKMAVILAGLQYERLHTIRGNNQGLLGPIPGGLQ